MPDRIAGFKGEYLWELDIPEAQLSALAEAIPTDRYGWRPADATRSVSAVLVHIAAGNFALLHMIGKCPPFAPYATIHQTGMEQFIAIVLTNNALEKTVTAKSDVVEMLKKSLAAVREAFTNATAVDLDAPGEFFGEHTTVRRVYLRILAHMHEHMGQLVAYVRTMGLQAPWPDPMDYVRAQAGGTGASN